MDKNHDYCSEPFITDCHDDYFTYLSVGDLIDRCENDKYKIIKCRTIGIIQSFNGNFFIKDLNGRSEAPMIRVSLAYMKSPLQSTVMPFSIQLFGTMQWRNRPVIFARLIQVLSVATAVRLNDAILKVSRTYTADTAHNDDDEFQ
nr:uncharacterized protein LOC116778762 [Danaus plexippus plexippus]